jgi:hypothetical protein
MRESLFSDFATVGIDPMREADPPTPADAKFPTRIRGGPDWLAFCGNWMTEWERTGDTTYRDKIIVGAKCLAAMPYGFRSGDKLVYGYDPKTGQLFERFDAQGQPVIGTYNLVLNMGGAEVGMELDTLLDDPSWRKIWRQYCRLSSAPAAVVTADMKSGTEGATGEFAGDPRLAAYAAKFTGNPAFGTRSLASLELAPYVPKPVGGAALLNPITEAAANTNSASQNSLTVIELLELLKGRLPTTTQPSNVRPNP